MHTPSTWYPYIPRHIKSLLHLFACESDWAYEVPAVALHTAAVFIVHTVVARCYCCYYYCPNTLSFMLLLLRHLVELSLRLLSLTSSRPYTLSLIMLSSTLLYVLHIIAACCYRYCHYYIVPSCCCYYCCCCFVLLSCLLQLDCISYFWWVPSICVRRR